MINGYVTRAEFLNWVTPKDTTADNTDDAVIDGIIEAASRYIDGACGRAFYPMVKSNYYDIPDGREILSEGDLLAVISLTNGDDTAIASTEYNLTPKNYSPHTGLKLKGSSSTYWTLDSSGDTDYVIDLLGIWGYHDQYDQRAWSPVGTLGAEIADTTTLAFTMTAGHSALKDNILMIENELLIVDTVVTNTVTPLARGDNGSTAATHANGTTVYAWQPMQEIAQATKLISQSLYRRFGHPNQGDESIITASGVIVTPKDVPGVAARTIATYRNKR